MSPFKTTCESKNGKTLTVFTASAFSWMFFILCVEKYLAALNAKSVSLRLESNILLK